MPVWSSELWVKTKAPYHVDTVVYGAILNARKAAQFARPGLRQGSERPAILESPVSGYMEDGLALPSEVQAAEFGEAACCLV